MAAKTFGIDPAYAKNVLTAIQDKVTGVSPSSFDNIGHLRRGTLEWFINRINRPPIQIDPADGGGTAKDAPDTDSIYDEDAHIIWQLGNTLDGLLAQNPITINNVTYTGRSGFYTIFGFPGLSDPPQLPSIPPGYNFLPPTTPDFSPQPIRAVSPLTRVILKSTGQATLTAWPISPKNGRNLPPYPNPDIDLTHLVPGSGFTYKCLGLIGTYDPEWATKPTPSPFVPIWKIPGTVSPAVNDQLVLQDPSIDPSIPTPPYGYVLPSKPLTGRHAYVPIYWLTRGTNPTQNWYCSLNEVDPLTSSGWQLGQPTPFFQLLHKLGD